MEVFSEPHFGYLRFNVHIKPIRLPKVKFELEEKVKFYFWINVGGTCALEFTSLEAFVSSGLNLYDHIRTYPKSNNGFKIMNNQKQMLKMILPDLSKKPKLELELNKWKNLKQSLASLEHASNDSARQSDSKANRLQGSFIDFGSQRRT